MKKNVVGRRCNLARPKRGGQEERTGRGARRARDLPRITQDTCCSFYPHFPVPSAAHARKTEREGDADRVDVAHEAPFERGSYAGLHQCCANGMNVTHC